MPAPIHAKHYHNRHRSQLEAGASQQTRHQGCTWTTGANGINASTGGKQKPAPDTVLRKVATREQTSPMTPGWSLEDLRLACDRFGLAFVVHTGEGWDAVRHWRNLGYYIALQGDSDVFDAGCMAVFDGDHCIGLHPDENRYGRWRVNDPLCPRATFRKQEMLREYAEKLDPKVRFGVFLPRVPLKEA